MVLCRGLAWYVPETLYRFISHPSHILFCNEVDRKYGYRCVALVVLLARVSLFSELQHFRHLIMFHRAMIWSKRPLIVGILAILSAGHWGIMIYSACGCAAAERGPLNFCLDVTFVTAQWDAVTVTCALAPMPPHKLAIGFTYSSCCSLACLSFNSTGHVAAFVFCFGIFAITTFGILAAATQNTRIWKLLTGDDVLFPAIATIATAGWQFPHTPGFLDKELRLMSAFCLVPMIFVFLDLNRDCHFPSLPHPTQMLTPPNGVNDLQQS